MLVKDIMNTSLKTATIDMPIKEIASIMCFNKISGMPVVDADNKIVGVISEKDILHAMFPDVSEIMETQSPPDFERLEGSYQDIMDKKAGDLMTKTISTVTPAIPVLKAAAIMWVKKIRRIPVTENEQLVGIISIGDVHKAIFQHSLLD